jgi:hypothetical protein
MFGIHTLPLAVSSTLVIRWKNIAPLVKQANAAQTALASVIALGRPVNLNFPYS